MRIGVDLLPIRHPLTGIGNYEFHLLKSMFRTTKIAAVEGFRHFNWTTVDADFLANIEIDGDLNFNRFNARQWLGERQWIRGLHDRLRNKAFARTVQSQSLTLYHAFAFTAPLHAAIPNLPVVYDLSFVRFPNLHPPS